MWRQVCLIRRLKSKSVKLAERVVRRVVETCVCQLVRGVKEYIDRTETMGKEKNVLVDGKVKERS